jgi:hypothetical protein
MAGKRYRLTLRTVIESRPTLAAWKAERLAASLRREHGVHVEAELERIAEPAREDLPTLEELLELVTGSDASQPDPA